MANAEKIDLFEHIPVPAAVAKLAIPTVLSSLVMILYNLADTYFIGILNDPVQNSAVTLSAPILLAFNAVTNLFGVGGSSMMSRALGCKDYDTVSRTSAFGFYGSLLCSLLFSLGCFLFETPLLTLLGADGTTMAATVTYVKWTVLLGAVPAIINVTLGFLIRAEGYSALASVGSIGGCLLNIVLDPFFALPFGLHMGVEGVALATFLSNCAACIYYFVLLRVIRRKSYIRISPMYLRPNREVVSGVFTVGISAAIQNLLNVTGMTILTNFTSGYGTTAIAAMGISQRISMIPMYIFLGLSQGISPLISYTYAGKMYPRMKRTITFTVTVTMIFSVVSTILFLIFSAPIAGIFMKNQEVIDCGARLIRGMCLALPVMCMDFIAVGVFQALGMGKEAMLFAVARKVLLEIPALFLLNYLFPLYGLAYAQFTAETVLAVAAAVMLVKLFGRLKREKAAEIRQTAEPSAFMRK